MAESHKNGVVFATPTSGDYGGKHHDEANITKSPVTDNGALLNVAPTDYVGPLIHEIAHCVKETPKVEKATTAI